MFALMVSVVVGAAPDITTFAVSAAFLVGVTIGGVELIKALWPGLAAMPAQKSRPIVVGIVIVMAQVMTFLVSYTVWAHGQVLGGAHLDQLNIPSRIVAALVIAMLAAFGDKFLGTIADIGVPLARKPLVANKAAIEAARVTGEKQPSSPAQPVSQ